MGGRTQEMAVRSSGAGYLCKKVTRRQPCLPTKGIRRGYPFGPRRIQPSPTLSRTPSHNTHLSVLLSLGQALLRLKCHTVRIACPLLGSPQLNDQLLLLCRNPGGDDCSGHRLSCLLVLRCRLLGPSQLPLQVGAPAGG